MNTEQPLETRVLMETHEEKLCQAPALTLRDLVQGRLCAQSLNGWPQLLGSFARVGPPALNIHGPPHVARSQRLVLRNDGHQGNQRGPGKFHSALTRGWYHQSKVWVEKRAKGRTLLNGYRQRWEIRSNKEERKNVGRGGGAGLKEQRAALYTRKRSCKPWCHTLKKYS